jgi:transcriptional regulator with XRE-family HTH domain
MLGHVAADKTEIWAVLTDEVDQDAVSVREIVAYNLARGRRRRDLSQADLGARLTKLTGTEWSRATVSAAEKGWRGKSGRVRKFDVDEVVAFACALEMPLSWFFDPPHAGDEPVVAINRVGRRVEDEPDRGDPKPYAVISAEKLREIAGVREDDSLAIRYPGGERPFDFEAFLQDVHDAVVRSLLGDGEGDRA